jgi:uncharacterized protein (DUF1778 family)
MPRRKSPDLTIRLTEAERRALDRATAVRHERGVSTWARKVLLEAAASPTGEEKARIAKEFFDWLRSNPPGLKEHADEVERLRSEGWARAPR